MFDSNQFLGGERGFYPLNIEQSLRFNDDDSSYLSRTPATAGNRKTWTWSGWVKLSDISTTGKVLFSTNGSTDSTFASIRLSTDYRLWFGKWTTLVKGADPLLRDPSAWYHIVVALDTTQATEANRIKFYINGIEASQQSSATINQNDEYGFNSTQQHAIGRHDQASNLYFDGYLAEVHFCDGTAYDADAFGEFKSGVWVAKSPSVTYGTNGFYLDFANSADIGNDVSGEGNDWTPNNFTASDVVLDSPTDNYATLNPIDSTVNNLSDGNLRVSTATSGSRTACGSIGENSGKWYWEVTSVGGSENIIGVVDTSYSGVSSTLGYQFNGSVFYYRSGAKSIDGSFTSYGASYTTNDVIGIALDLDGGTVAFYKNNVSQGSITLPSTGTGSWKPSLSSGTGAANQIYSANFGQLGFTYTPPTGYLALSTANLPEPTISPADDESPSDYFNTVLYTGADPNAAQSITGVGFQPDFLWIKSRVTDFGHALQDAVRGSTKRLQSDTTGAESTSATFVSSFDSDGFSLGTDFGQNAPNEPYVAWNWKANGSGVSNTDGTITSTVSANTTSGFSIVSYTGTGANATVGHGLDSEPNLIIVKSRSIVDGWLVYSSELGATKFLVLSSTIAAGTSTATWNDTAPTSTVFSIGTNSAVNQSSATYIAYCFHSVEGFSKFGSYTGNGSADGPFVYTGFRPAFVITKRTNGTSFWWMADSSRSPFNEVGERLQAESSSAAFSYEWVDFTSNGFKFRDTETEINGSGSTFIYMAFAENGGPFKYSRAR